LRAEDTFHDTYKTLSDQDKATVREIKFQANALLMTIAAHVSESREKSIAKTKLEECVMWAVKGITA
jgi:hypothetical protein